MTNSVGWGGIAKAVGNYLVDLAKLLLLYMFVLWVVWTSNNARFGTVEQYRQAAWNRATADRKRDAADRWHNSRLTELEQRLDRAGIGTTSKWHSLFAPR